MVSRIRPETAFLNQVSKIAAADSLPQRPIEITSMQTFDALKSKLVKMAHSDPAKASGMYDLLAELNEKNLISLNFNAGPLGHARDVMWGNMMNAIADVLNANAVEGDDKPYIPLPRNFPPMG